MSDEIEADGERWVPFSTVMHVHSMWFTEPASLARRIQSIIGASSSYAPTPNDRNSWQIDSTNDWYVTIEPETKMLQIRYRYGMTQEFWDALKIVIESLPDLRKP